MAVNFVGHVESFVGIRIVESFFERDDVFDAERFAVARRRILLDRGESDVRLDFDKRRAIFVSLRRRDCLADCVDVVAVLNRPRAESERLHALLNVFGERNIRRAFDCDSVAVVQNNQLAQAEITRQ